MNGARQAALSGAAGCRLTRLRTESPAASDDGGSITLLMVVLAVVLLGAVGLVVDGGAKIRAAQQADVVAAEAARAGGQQIRIDEAMVNGEVIADPIRARSAANAYLRSAGMEGSVSITHGGSRIAVSTRESVDTIFLGLLGVGVMRVSGHAEAQLVRQRMG